MSLPQPKPAIASTPARRWSDSPWFWAYLFGVGALGAILLAGPKYSVRQAHIEREYQGRTRAAQNLNGQEPSLPMSTPGQTLIGLKPLVVVLGVATVGAWLVYWRSSRLAATGPVAENRSTPGPVGGDTP